MSPDLHAFVGAYALDALDHDERIAFEEHLATCGPCRTEMAEMVETAARLGSVAEIVPAPAMRSRVLDAIGRSAQERPNVVSLQERRSRWSTNRGLGVAAALLAVLGVGVGVQQFSENQDRSRTDVAQAEKDAQAKQKALIADVLTAGDKVAYDTQLDSGLHLTVVKSQKMDAAVVSLRDLPDLPDGRSYQLWQVTGGTVTSAGVIEADDISHDRATALIKDVGGTQSVALTEEPAGGSDRPTADPLVDLDIAT